MLIKTIASVFAVMAVTGYAYADSCPDTTNIYKTAEGFAAKDKSGRIWAGENPGVVTVDNKTFAFESASYITEDEDENGPVKVSQLSCRYQNLALVLDKVEGWKPTSREWDNSNNCTKSISACSFSMSNK